MPSFIRTFSLIILNHKEEFSLKDLISMLSEMYKKNCKKI